MKTALTKSLSPVCCKQANKLCHTSQLVLKQDGLDKHIAIDNHNSMKQLHSDLWKCQEGVREFKT